MSQERGSHRRKQPVLSLSGAPSPSAETASLRPRAPSRPLLPETLGCLLRFSLNVATVVRQMLGTITDNAEPPLTAERVVISTEWLRSQANLSLSTSCPWKPAAPWAPSRATFKCWLWRGMATWHQTCWLFQNRQPGPQWTEEAAHESHP